MLFVLASSCIILAMAKCDPSPTSFQNSEQHKTKLLRRCWKDGFSIPSSKFRVCFLIFFIYFVVSFFTLPCAGNAVGDTEEDLTGSHQKLSQARRWKSALSPLSLFIPWNLKGTFLHWIRYKVYIYKFFRFRLPFLLWEREPKKRNQLDSKHFFFFHLRGRCNLF